jgi:hypothetical protein
VVCCPPRLARHDAGRGAMNQYLRGHTADITGMAEFDAVDGAHSAASKCLGWLRRNEPLEGSHCERSKQFPRWLADAVEYMQAVFDDVEARRARDAI